MTDQYPNPTEYTTPLVTLIITTYELAEEPKDHYFWNATVSHIFHGETIERVHEILNAHRKTDVFFDGSFKGEWNGIILKNSEPQIM
jgi:hypothetical protein